ncbi:chorismate synthase [Pararhodospirillum photometricum]|uniref:Chorismate synthase n=1 Tax=Pararhodospirillum photometricum DSM 122 TaxID=1150469 RepID=H6SIQ4_PARPM|nr:chorismate synthase [Pararhodospirillum photometricum]CCG06681.1 Chorismate synthase [Pararhodospirillum photometricum DSM 122]
MAGDSFGTLFRFTSFGESHGPALGCVVEGTPPGVPLDVAAIQRALDRRKPGQSRFTTQRREDDAVEILSGVYEGLTTGTPIAFLIRNTDQRSHDYAAIAQRFRPGHADYTYWQKYGLRDPRGGGRSSARETAARVAAGALAEQVLRHLLGTGFLVRGALVEMGGVAIDRARWDWGETVRNPFFAPDAAIVPQWETLLDGVRKDGSSVGAVIEVEALGVPAGLGEPVYDRLDADLAKALMSINAVKGVEIGAGFASARLRGEQNADEMEPDGQGGVRFCSNNAGGILGGISSGQPVVARLAVKPTSSLLIPRHSVDTAGQPVEVVTKGRHDPCVGIRAVPVAEAMVSVCLLDHLLRFRGQCGARALPR